MADARTKRAMETREETGRGKQWKPPSLLPTPDPQEGWEFRWVRTSMLGSGDTVNVSSKFREGWEPVSKEEFPELKILSDLDSRFPENIEVGGLLLCKAPRELMEQRRAYQAARTAGQMDAVDNNYMREGDPRMPLLAPERSSRVSRFGSE